MLALRLAKVIHSIMGPNQTAFLAGRQILDGCLIANEIIRMANLEDHKLLLFKVVFEKAFDSVSWAFLQDVMSQMRFGLKWRNWTRAYLSSASISVLINGAPMKEFQMERGLRQGDPLSPFLFLLVAEALQVSILDACIKGLFKGVSLANNEDNLSLLQYADDALFFGFLVWEWIFTRMMSFCNGWEEVVNRVRNKLSAWKAKSLSIGSRLTLIKSVLGSIPIYYLSFFKAPLKIINLIESLRAWFFWGFKDKARGISWVKWNSILLNYKMGRLGVGSIHAKNLGLLGKWKWRYLTKKMLYEGKLLKTSMAPMVVLTPLAARLRHGTWCKILKAVVNTKKIDPSFEGSFSLKISNGSNAMFWKDPWVNGGADSWVWSIEALGIFKVNSLSLNLHELLLADHSLGSYYIWNSWILRKVNICVWRASVNRLPTSEFVDHSLLLCPRIKPILEKDLELVKP
nr:reverse transcriptase domain, reverse transcriptase zinc-binding domain protein [Tanacetum cinerariifolium]